jgi:hypothetical protein
MMKNSVKFQFYAGSVARKGVITWLSLQFHFVFFLVQGKSLELVLPPKFNLMQRSLA